MKTTIIAGSMFAGKSNLLNKQIREVRRHDIFHVMVFKPKLDDRYDINAITTHDNIKESVDVLIEKAEDIWTYYSNNRNLIPFNKRILCFIDEVQFLNASSIVEVIRNLNREGVEVVAAGLDMDKFGRPFGATPYVMAIADEVIKLRTKCSCGNDSYTQVSVTDNNELIEIGADSYKPVCKKCFFDFEKKF